MRYAARYELARTAEDVLARRNRALFLDSEAAMLAAPEVAVSWPRNSATTPPGSSALRDLEPVAARIACAEARDFMRRQPPALYASAALCAALALWARLRGRDGGRTAGAGLAPPTAA